MAQSLFANCCGIWRVIPSIIPVSPPRSTKLQVNGRASRAWIVAVVALSVVLGSAVAVATDRFLNRRIAEARLASDNPNVPVAFHVFWKGFLTGPQEPWVIFSNAAFVGRP